MVNLTGMMPPALGGEQETAPPSSEPEMDLNKTQQFSGAIKGEIGLSDDLMEEVEDYLKNPPPKPKQSPIDAAIDAGYLIAKKISKDKTKYLSGIAEYNPEGNKAIRGMFKNALGADPDWNPTEVAWCATFVSQVLSDLGADPLRSKDRYDRVRADKYKNYGSPVEIGNITEGDIVVLDFDGDGRGDHATFYVGDKDDINNNPDSPYISVLGGNQGDAVSIRDYAKENILAIRRITYDDIDYEFTKELARDNADFNAFLKKEGEGFDMKSLEENPMSPSNTPMTSFDEGGFASKALDFLTSPLTGDYRKEKPTSVQMAELGVEASPVGTVGDIVEDPSLSNIAMSVAPDLLGLGPVKGVARTLIRKGADKVSDTIKTVDGDVYDYDDIVKLEDTVDDWAKGYLTNKQLRQKLSESGVKINNPKITKKMDPTDIEFGMPDGGSYKYGQIPTTSRPAKYDQEMISVFPKPERMFPEDARPKGGDYLNPATGEVISGRNVSAATLKISPDGKPSFKVSNDDVESVGSTGKGKTQIKTNLFKKKAGWKWKNAPEGMEDIATLISVENKGKHYYTIETDFSKGVNLKKYPNSKTEPRLRPTVVGEIELGPQVGTISVRGKEHPVYSRVRTFNQGGPVMNEQMEMAFMQEGGIKDDGMKRDPVSGNEIPPGSMASEVRDDIPAMLSEGEYVVPADVLRFYGVNFFEGLRNKAKSGLQNMEANGRIGGEPLSPDQVQQNMSGQPQAGAPARMPVAANTGPYMAGQPQGLQQAQGMAQNFNPMNYGVVGGSTLGGGQQQESVTTFKTYVNAETGQSKVLEYINGQLRNKSDEQYTVPPYYEFGSAALKKAQQAASQPTPSSGDDGGSTPPPEPKDPNEWAKEITDPMAWANENLQGKANSVIDTVQLGTSVARVNAMAIVADAQGNKDLAEQLRGKAREFVAANPVLNSLPNAWIDGDQIAADLQKDKDRAKNLFGMKTEEQKKFAARAEQRKSEQRAKATEQRKKDEATAAAALKAAQSNQDDDDPFKVTDVQIDRDPMGQSTTTTTYEGIDPGLTTADEDGLYKGGLMARKKAKKKK